MKNTKALLLVLTLMFAAHEAAAGCSEKRSRDPSFVELAVPDGSPRPASAEDFKFITDETTYDQLVAKVGPPDASSGSRTSYFIWCFADGTELTVATKDRVAIENVRYEGHQIFKRGKKKE
jgi:hypothetical protein